MSSCCEIGNNYNPSASVQQYILTHRAYPRMDVSRSYGVGNSFVYSWSAASRLVPKGYMQNESALTFCKFCLLNQELILNGTEIIYTNKIFS